MSPYAGYPNSRQPIAIRTCSNAVYPAFRPSTYGGPITGALYGAADLINSEGNFLVSRQHADLIKEHTFTAKLDNRRRSIEESLFEREQLPTVQDERERTQHIELRRNVTDPPITEIRSAKALNELLIDIQKHQARGSKGSHVSLDEGTLQRINVTSGRSGANAGLLKNEGRVAWPAALRGAEFRAERDRLAALLPGAITQAAENQIDAAAVKTMLNVAAQMEKRLVKDVENLAPGRYLEAKRFLGQLQCALTIFQQADAVNYFNGKYAPAGKSVADLVKHMTDKGLRFAAAVEGDEEAYSALYQALSYFDVVIQSQATAGR